MYGIGFYKGKRREQCWGAEDLITHRRALPGPHSKRERGLTAREHITVVFRILILGDHCCFVLGEGSHSSLKLLAPDPIYPRRYRCRRPSSRGHVHHEVYARRRSRTVRRERGTRGVGRRQVWRHERRRRKRNVLVLRSYREVAAHEADGSRASLTAPPAVFRGSSLLHQVSQARWHEAVEPLRAPLGGQRHRR